MIDLNREPTTQADEDTPFSIVIMTLMPFAWLFWFLIERGL